MNQQIGTLGLKPTSKLTFKFENDSYDLIQKVEFTNVQNTFQPKLKKDAQSIKSSNNMLVFADKSTNLYELSRDLYEKLLQDNITQTYQKTRY